MTKLTTREAINSVMLMNMIGATKQYGSSKTFDRILDSVRERQAQNPLDPLDHAYDVEVRVNGIEVDFRDFTKTCVDQLDAMVLDAAKELLAESAVIEEMNSTLYDLQEKLKEYAELVESKLKKEYGK